MPEHNQRPTPVRWIGAVLCILYGFAKLNGSQFTVLDSELTRPLGQVNGFWLTWYYFSFSTVYGTLIALVQIAGGILLVWPRTALLGALVLLPVITNIILIDVFYGISAGATLVAILILACLIAVIFPHAARLRAAVLLEPRNHHPRLRVAAVGFVLVFACGFTWWTANHNNRHPTMIDGIWSVVPGTESDDSVLPWRKVFFERNRAHWVTFRSGDGTDERHHFEVDENGIVRIWQTWLTKGDLIMEGRVRTDGLLELEAIGADPSAGVLLELERPTF